MEASISEQFAKNADGTTDTSMLIYDMMDPYIAKGKRSTKFPLLRYWFKTNGDSFPTPAGLSIQRANKNSIANFSTVDFIPSLELAGNKNLLVSFFTDTSAFFRNLVGTRTKGGSLTPEERKNTRMFLIVVASTADSSLIPNCAKDANKVVDLFTDIAKNVLGIRLFVDSVYGDRYNKPAVDAAISKLRPGKNDLVVFYYSGHGFTDRNFKDKDFPFLDLRDPNKRPRPDARTMTMNIQNIYDTIVSRGARFNLVLSDCCNDTIEAKKTPGTRLPGSRGITRASFDNVKALFMNPSQMNILMTAASKDERAIITPSYSSYFTNFFVESVRSFCSPEKNPPNWYQVLGEAQKQTRKQTQTETQIKNNNQISNQQKTIK